MNLKTHISRAIADLAAAPHAHQLNPVGQVWSHLKRAARRR